MRAFQRRMCPGAAALLLVLWQLVATPAAGAKEGFGLARETVRMSRVGPPAVALGGNRFLVKVDSAAGIEAGLNQYLQRRLERELVARDSRLAVDGKKPQILIELKVLRNELADRWETRLKRELQKMGKDEGGKTIFKTVGVKTQHLVVVHDFAVSYQVSDAASGAILDSGTIEAPYEGSFRDGRNALFATTIEDRALTKVVDGVARRLAPWREEIAVLLPRGRLEGPAALAEAGDWSRYRDEVAALAPSPDREDEAYRQFALATANEALAYAAADPAQRLEYLELAEGQYRQAIAANPGEKLFAKKTEAQEGQAAVAAPLERVSEALAGFRKVAAAPPPPAAAEPAGAMDNAAIIRMVREGKGGYAILTAIKTAKEHNFDLSPAGLAELTEANVDPKIIARLHEFSGKE